MANPLLDNNISSKNTRTYQFTKLSSLEKRAYSYGRRIGLLIGSFDPAHFGHFNMAETIRKKAKLDYIWWLPSPLNPHKICYKFSINDRVKMIKNLINSSSYKKFHAVIQLEQAINTNKTYNLLKYLTMKDKRKFFLILGQDNFIKIDSWYKWQYMIKFVDILVYKRLLLNSRTINNKEVFSITFKNSKVATIWPRQSSYSSRDLNYNSKKWQIITGPVSNISSSKLQ